MDPQTAIAYGPQTSRRFGRSLVVNLAPAGRKACNFACTYCRSAWSEPPARRDWPSQAEVTLAVERALAACDAIDSIVLAGNGEPTLHPAFAPIADALCRVRQRLHPDARLVVVSNGSTLNRLEVLGALGRFDVRCMKLDAGDATTFRRVNAAPVTLGRLLGDLRRLQPVTLASTFVRDATGPADNTTAPALDAWLEAVERIRPAEVHIGTLDRNPRPGSSVERVPANVLEAIAARVRAVHLTARVFA